MSRNTLPTITSITTILQNASQWILSVYENRAEKEALIYTLLTFAKVAILSVISHDQLYPSCNPSIQPSSNTKELKQIQTSLQALSRVVTSL
jgi:hypothetical protein